MTSPKHHKAKRDTKRYQFHPIEISFCALSGSGKTTLIEKLCAHWRGCNFAYIKHDVHGFSFDTPGKDTFRIGAAGASGVLINNAEQMAMITKGSHIGSLLLDHDFAVVEGYKSLSIHKVVVLDAEMKILEYFPAADAEPILYVGAFDENTMRCNHPNLGPYLHRDNIDAIAQIIDAHFVAACERRPLHGLILAGGRSTRMGQDKAKLRYQEKSQLEICHQLLQSFCKNVFVSMRAEQKEDAAYAKYTAVVDSFLDMGPVGGILSAMRSQPDAAWLVIAVDLPLLKVSTLQRLIEQRDPFKFATVYQAVDADFLEPLCAIYEPKCYARFLGFLGEGRECPAGMLRKIPVKILQQEMGGAELRNVNHWDEYQECSQEKYSTTPVPQVPASRENN